MSEPWMYHPKLVAWFDDLEDAVTTALALTDDQRAGVRALRAPRNNTWVMFAGDANARDALRAQLMAAQDAVAVPVAHDCGVLSGAAEFVPDADTFEQDNGFGLVDVDYVEEGSAEAVRRELLSDACDYAASDEEGWFYAIMDGEYDFEGNDQGIEGQAF